MQRIEIIVFQIKSGNKISERQKNLTILCSLNTDGTKTEKDTFNNKKCEGSKEK